MTFKVLEFQQPVVDAIVEAEKSINTQQDFSDVLDARILAASQLGVSLEVYMRWVNRLRNQRMVEIAKLATEENPDHSPDSLEAKGSLMTAVLNLELQILTGQPHGTEAVALRKKTAEKFNISLEEYVVVAKQMLRDKVEAAKLSGRQGGDVVSTPEAQAQKFYGKLGQISGESSEWHQKIVEANEAKRKVIEDLELHVAELQAQLVEATKIKQLSSSVDFLNYAATIQGNRAATYDSPEGERSMAKTVTLLNTLRGLTLKTSDGWLLLTLLKLVRGEARAEFHADSAVDAVSYMGLYAEELKRESYTPHELHEGF